MKTFNKIISLILISCTLLFSFIMNVSAETGRKKALPLSAGLEELRKEFEYDTGDMVNGYALDYCYYSPVGENDNGKYPIVLSSSCEPMYEP